MNIEYCIYFIFFKKVKDKNRKIIKFSKNGWILRKRIPNYFLFISNIFNIHPSS